MIERNRCRSAGFTLVELLVTLALMTVIFSILFSMIGGGVKIWERLKCGVRQEHDIYFALDSIRRGLHGLSPFEPIRFKGASERMDFSVLLNPDIENSDSTLREPGQRSYYFDKNSRTLCESERLYRGMRRDNRAEKCKPLAQNIDKVRFTYLFYNATSKGFLWRGYWSDKQPPISVKVELDYDEPCSEKKSRKEFLVSIPVGAIG